MSKKKRQKKVDIDIQTRIHQMLRADLQCSEDEIHMIDQALKGMVTQEIADHVTQAAQGLLPPLPKKTLHLDMGDGEAQEIRLTDHPIHYLYHFLSERYSPRFTHLLWTAITCSKSPTQYYQMLGFFKKAPFFAEMLEDDRNEAES